MFLFVVIISCTLVFYFNPTKYIQLIHYDSLSGITLNKFPGISFEIKNELATKNSSRTAELKMKVVAALTTTRPPGPLREESCDIETALLFLRMNKNSSIANYTDPLANVIPIGGSNWLFNKKVPCVLDQNIFNSTNQEQFQTFIACSNEAVTVKKIKIDSNSSAQIFKFPDACLGKVISTSCGDGKRVPNVVHYIWFGNIAFDFIYFVSFYSVHKYQKPCLILLYYEFLPSGKWWNLLRHIVHNIVLVQVTPPTFISGKKIKFVQHKADIMRLIILKEYGGIYMDTDEYFLRPGDELRNSNCTMGKAHDKSIGSALIYAEKGALFIEKWIDSYKNYDPSKWGDNSVLMAEKLARKFPDLIHVFEHHCAFYPHGLVLYNQNYKWSHSYGLHIYKGGHRPELQKINFETVRNINNTIGAVFGYILFGSKELCSS